MPRIQEVKGRLSLTLPSQIARLKGWKKGDELYFNVDSKTGSIQLNIISNQNNKNNNLEL